MASTTKSLLAAKKAEQAKMIADAQADGTVDATEQAALDKEEAELQALVAQEVQEEEIETQNPVQTSVTDADIQASNEVAKDSGATELPGPAEDGTMVSILKQNDTPTVAEVQTQRSSVDTHTIILPSDPEGTNVANPNPPNGTLPNDGMIAVDTGMMGSQENSMQAGLAMNQISDEENAKAVAAWEGEQRRQRMLEGRPRDTDLADDQASVEAPAGGYKSNGILRFANAKGNWVNAVNGYFVPADDEEKAILDHYVKTFVVDAPAS